MNEHDKLLDRMMQGTSDGRFWFHGMCSLLRKLGFQEHIRRNRHIFTKDNIEEILNLQPRAGLRAKPYQVKQVRQIIRKYSLGDREEDDR